MLSVSPFSPLTYYLVVISDKLGHPFRSKWGHLFRSTWGPISYGNWIDKIIHFSNGLWVDFIY